MLKNHIGVLRTNARHNRFLVRGAVGSVADTVEDDTQQGGSSYGAAANALQELVRLQKYSIDRLLDMSKPEGREILGQSHDDVVITREQAVLCS